MDNINHPSHYTYGKLETIDIINDIIGDVGVCNFCRGKAIKYLFRAGKKTESNLEPHRQKIQDLKKAKWYIEKEISILEQLNDEKN